MRPRVSAGLAGWSPSRRVERPGREAAGRGRQIWKSPTEPHATVCCPVPTRWRRCALGGGATGGRAPRRDECAGCAWARRSRQNAKLPDRTLCNCLLPGGDPAATVRAGWRGWLAGVGPRRALGCALARRSRRIRISRTEPYVTVCGLATTRGGGVLQVARRACRHRLRWVLGMDLGAACQADAKFAEPIPWNVRAGTAIAGEATPCCDESSGCPWRSRWQRMCKSRRQPHGT